jgi:hypothetical protein
MSGGEKSGGKCPRGANVRGEKSGGQKSGGGKCPRIIIKYPVLNGYGLTTRCYPNVRLGCSCAGSGPLCMLDQGSGSISSITACDLLVLKFNT